MVPNQNRFGKCRTGRRTFNIPAARHRISSVSASCIKLRHIITKLYEALPPEAIDSAEAKELAGYGCYTRIHVVRLLAPSIDNEDHTKDVDFSPRGIRERWDAGYQHTAEMLAKKPWQGDFDPLEGFILHETMGGNEVVTIPPDAPRGPKTK